MQTRSQWLTNTETMKTLIHWIKLLHMSWSTELAMHLNLSCN